MGTEADIQVEATEPKEEVVAEKPNEALISEIVNVSELDFERIKSETEALKLQLSELNEQLTELRAYKALIEEQERKNKVEALVQEFSDLPIDDVNAIVATNDTYENIELKLFAMRGRFSTKTPANRIQSYLISDSIIKNGNNEPSWFNLVDKYKKNNEGGY